MRRRIDLAVAVVAGATLLFLVAIRLHPGGAHAARVVDDLGQLAAALIATIACARQARRCPPAAVRCWALLAGGSAAWAAGETAWSYYELVANVSTPFPSVADAGYLLFPALAAAGLLLWPSVALHGSGRWRTLLDAVLVAGSLFIVSWVTALGTVARAGHEPGAWFGYTVSLAYPVTDLVLLTLTVVLVTHTRRTDGSGLSQLAAGLVLLCIADSGFAYLTAQGSYATGSPVDAGWVAGFLLIAVAAHRATPPATSTPTAGAAAAALAAPDSATTDPDPAAAVESTTRALLPYLPAAIGLTVALAGVLTGRGQQLALIAATVVMAALLGRQLLAVLDNRRLVTQLLATQAQLRHQAFHDPLTGLANRALFTDRLRHGLDLHRRDLRPLSLLYCDLDGFKTVNDTLGHDAGDDVLKAVAERLLAITRPGDTVARLGGDEFAILVEDGGDSAGVAARILAAFAQPATTGRHTVPLAGSIGIAELAPDAFPLPAAELLRRADAAMYLAKHTGTGHVVTWTDELVGQTHIARRVPGQPHQSSGAAQPSTAAP